MPTPLTRRALVALLALAGPAARGAEPPPAADPWQPLRRFVGDWAGSSNGRSGEATVTRRYAWALNERYLHETSTSVYPPQERNPKGERHEHWGLFSHDRLRKTLVLRQFHVEGFVNTYRRVDLPEWPAQLVFESESFENFNSSWRARERYEFVDEQAFVETFELAPPGKDFETYSRTRLQRVAR
jgi:hypothetical protein